MRSRLPKMLHPLAGRPLVLHALGVAAEVTGRRPLVVVSPDQPEVTDAVAPQADTVEQPHPRGAGDALRSIPTGQRQHQGPLLVLSGDVPLLRPTTLQSLLDHHQATGAAATLLTITPHDPKGLGRILRDPQTGRITTDNAQAEYYPTDVVALIDGPVEALKAQDALEALGVNDRVQLARAAAEIRRRTLESLMLEGVTVEAPATTYVDPSVRVGRDSVLKPMTVLSGDTTLGEDCVVGPMAQLRDVHAGDRVSIGPSMLEECELADDVGIGAYVRVRPGTRLAARVQRGTHAAVKSSRIGAGSPTSHFSAVLDSEVGEGVNIGAGTGPCHYDGVSNHGTTTAHNGFAGT